MSYFADMMASFDAPITGTNTSGMGGDSGLSFGGSSGGFTGTDLSGMGGGSGLQATPAAPFADFSAPFASGFGGTGLLGGGGVSPAAETSHGFNMEKVMGNAKELLSKTTGMIDSTFGEGTSKMLLAASLQAYGQNKQNESAAKQREKELTLAQKYKLDQMDKTHEQAQIRFSGDRRGHKEFK